MATMQWYEFELLGEEQEREETLEADPINDQIHVGRCMLVGIVHYRKLIDQVVILRDIRRELDRDDPRRQEIYDLIGRINAKLAESKLDAAKSLVRCIKSQFDAIGRALQENDFVNARACLNSHSLQFQQRQLFQAPPWLVDAIEQVTDASYGSALQNFNEVLAAAKNGLVRREAEHQAAQEQRTREAIERERQRVRDNAKWVDKKIVERCKAEVSRIKESIKNGNFDAAVSMLTRYRIDIRYRDAILAVEGRVPEEFFREIEAQILQGRREKARR